MSLLKAPKQVGDYQLGNLIDKGAMALVYRGLNIKTG